MRLPLFWKILLGFWATLILTLQVSAAVLPVFGGRVVLGSAGLFQTVREMRERELGVAMRHGGEQTMRELVAAWPPQERAQVRIVATPSGVRAIYGPPPRQPLLRSVAPIAFWVLGSLAFSAALAAYLTHPIGRLRRGFRRLADGGLETRLGSQLGRRRDEIADLGKDFDSMADRLQQLVASRDRLLQDVSHELRSPLARMRVAMDLARQNPERTTELLGRIEAEENRLSVIIGDLLSLSRAESGAGDVQLYFDVAALLEVICSDARFEAAPHAVDVDLSIAQQLSDPAHAPLVAGDPELVRRALENVVRNAVRFSPNGATVKVNARIENGWILIEVHDHGPGADPQVRDIMFDPFVKGAGEASGAGLGLAIARRALLAHRGRIEAAEPENGGMLIRITIPPAGFGGEAANQAPRAFTDRMAAAEKMHAGVLNGFRRALSSGSRRSPG